jgi:anti-anti-sigma factor
VQAGCTGRRFFPLAQWHGRRAASAGAALVAAVLEDALPVEWAGEQAVVLFPEHVDAANVAALRDQLLALVNRSPAVLIVDMSDTVSCDQSGADALVRTFQRASVNGTQLRLVVAVELVRRVLEVNGLDRLISIYPSVETAAARSGTRTEVMPRTGSTGDGQRSSEQRTGPVVTPALLSGLIDALADGVALADADGVLVLVNRRLEEMLGYRRGELAGRPVEDLLPDDLRSVHVGFRIGYELDPRARPMGVGARQLALRSDGATIPVQISLTPVPTATSRFTLAVVRDVTEERRREDLADMARAAVAETQVQLGRELLERVVRHLFEVGLSLQGAIDLPHDVAGGRITAALERLDDVIHEVRSYAFATGGNAYPPGPAPLDDAC